MIRLLPIFLAAMPKAGKPIGKIGIRRDKEVKS